MVWLLACFGISKKRKRLNPAHNVHSQNTFQGIGSYKLLQLESSASPVPGASEDRNPGSSLKIRRGSCDNQGRATSIRKKVRFDLNVIAYEPISAYCDDGGDNEDDDSSYSARTWGVEEDEEEEESLARTWAVEEDDEESSELPLRLKRAESFHGSYRYSNQYEDEEEEEIGSGISDLDETDEEDDTNGDSFFDPYSIYHEVSDTCELLSSTPAGESETAYDSLKGGPSRTLYVKNPVLIPIENLNQWKAIKAKKF